MNSSTKNAVALTLRERHVMLLVQGGKTNQQIAKALSVTERTVRFHLRNVFRKLGVSNRTHAVAKAIHLGLIGNASANG